MGVERVVLRVGSGPSPRTKSVVTIHIRGMLHGNRKEFWSTLTKNQPFSFVLGVAQVIRGIDEGVSMMKLGEKAELICSADFGYGTKGFTAWGIKPNEALIFEVELLKIE